MTSIYLHWPFCKSKCPYCDFNSHVTNNVNMEDFINAYLIELDYYKEYLQNKTINSIYFGGGTPSLAPTSFFDKTLNKISTLSNISSDVEITIEANPTSIEVQKFSEFKKTGINRVSVGIQSLTPQQLKFLGREHSAKEAINALQIVSKYFDNYSFDLIYALPQQTLEDWQKELEFALQHANKHMSLYQLTIEKGTRFFSDYSKGKFTMPEENLAADFYLLTQDIMSQHNMPGYEISNHAAPNFESKHNLNYWNYGDYLGIGAGAHGRCSMNGKKHSTMTYHLPEKWLHTVNDKQVGFQKHDSITKEMEYEEKVMMGLRTIIRKDVIKNKEALEMLLFSGLLQEDQSGYITATMQGKLLLNSITEQILYG